MISIMSAITTTISRTGYQMRAALGVLSMTHSLELTGKAKKGNQTTYHETPHWSQMHAVGGAGRKQAVQPT